MVVAGLIILLACVLLVIAMIYGGGDSARVDLGAFDLDATSAVVFFLGMATLLLVVLGLGLVKGGLRRSKQHRQDRRKAAELDRVKRDQQSPETSSGAPSVDRPAQKSSMPESGPEPGTEPTGRSEPRR